MAKRFNLRFSRVIPSFRFCRSKKPSNLAETPGLAIHRLSPLNPKVFDICYPNLPAPPPSTPDDSFVKRHLSPKTASVGCGRARSCTQHLSPDVSFESLDYSSKKETTRLRAVAKAHNSKPQRKNEETETIIITSRSFSDDSPFVLDQTLTGGSFTETKRSKKRLNNGKKVMKRLRSFGSKTKRGALSSENMDRPARGSVKEQQPQAAEGKVRESVAVVTESEDPYEDFKRSMVEMVLEKEMFEAKDLEQLLQCFLSLNSREYHEIIVEAFTEIWEALFCDYPINVL
ncbi:hypothetical protein HRI_002794000 [Hibiscus trionum]|uniref:Transcription repressor n=1 Tax=Hibiscus trionum TaxID=183268 RepID=A0A9W7M605_HIBTR|nr:hypothetical protein HRI_002794000 [Hibiscus trionum]